MTSGFELNCPTLCWSALRRLCCAGVLAVGLLPAATCRLDAATYYVRPDGNDSNTGTGISASEAWATVAAAATKSLSPGDVVYVMSGTYVGEPDPTVDGTSGNPIRFIADREGDVFGTAGKVTLVAPANSEVLDLNFANYLDFVGFRFQGGGAGQETIAIDDSDYVTFEKCEIFDGVYDGIDIETSIITFSNCLIYNNDQNGIDVRSNATVTIMNCTIVDNSSDGVLVSSGTTTIQNSIIANNSDDGLDLNGGTLNHTYNLVYGNSSNNFEGTSSSTGEISVDPLFVGSGNYYLQANSPAIDAGTDAAGIVDDDLNGNPRPINSKWDLGCYEAVGLIGHWKLDETSGTTATDQSPYGNNGTYTNGPILGGSGPYRYAAEFDGNDNRVVVADDPSLQMTTVVTMAAWVKPVQTGNSELMIVNKEGEYAMALTDTGELKWAYENTDPGWSWHSTGAIVPDGKWSHVAVTYDNGTVRTYVDGQLVDTYNGSGTIGDQNPAYNDLWIGGRSNNPTGASFGGLIDDVRIYKDALTGEQVAELYGLLGHWKLDEPNGTTAIDSSGLDNHGTFQGGASPGASGPYPGAGASAAEFEGNSGDKIALPTMDYDFSDGLTMSVWYKVDLLSGPYTDFFSLSNGQLVDDIWFGLNNSIGLGLFLSDTAGGAAYRGLNEGKAPDVGKWMHVVAVLDADGNCTLYRNGEIVATGTVGLPRNTRRAANGIGETPFGQTLDGLLHDVRLYNRPLPPSEISEIYGLVGHWKMDEGAGGTASDSTGFANDATLSGATWTTDCVGNSGIQFDGLGDTAVTGSSFDPPEMGTVAFWFRSAGPVASRQRPWGLDADFEMWLDTDGLLSCDVSTEGLQGGFITDERIDEENLWRHIVAQYDSSDDSYAIYLDGELHKSGISTRDIHKQAANLLTFGTRTGNTQYWEGAIRDFRVYNRLLLNDEIAELAGVIAHWKFNETSGTIAADASAAGNDATYLGAPTLGVNGPFTAKTGGAVELDGASTYVETAESLLNNLTEFTMAGWIRPNSVTPDISLFGQYDLIQLGIASLPNQIEFSTRNGGSVSATGYLPLGKWTHLAAVGDGTELKLYVNGVQVANGGTSTANYGSNIEVFKIGEGVLSDMGDYFDGRLDDVRVFSRALCPLDVRSLYKGGRPSGIRIIKWVEIR